MRHVNGIRHANYSCEWAEPCGWVMWMSHENESCHTSEWMSQYVMIKKVMYLFIHINIYKYVYHDTSTWRVDESCEHIRMIITIFIYLFESCECLDIHVHWCIYCLIIQKDMRSWWAMWIILFTWMNHITRSSEWVMWMNNLNESWDTYEWIRNYSNNWVMSHVRTDEYCKWTIWMRHDTHMGWLRIVGSMKLYVSFAEWCLFYRALLSCL